MTNEANKFLAAFMVFTLAFVAEAKFYPSASTGPQGDSTGEQMRGTITKAIADADSILEILASTDTDQWPESWRDFYGTAAATAAQTAVIEIRSGLTGIRDSWDQLSVQTVALKKGWNGFYVYVDDPSPAAAVINPAAYAERLASRVSVYFTDPAATGPVDLLARIRTLAGNLVDVRERLIAAYTTAPKSNWPIADLYVYMGSTDAASQFDTDSSSEAKASNPYLTWSAAAPDSLNLASIPAGHVCTAFSTNSASMTIALLGTGVRAGSMSWHKTGGSDNPAEWNYLGVVTASSRLDAGKLLTDIDFTNNQLAKLSGTDPAEPSFTAAMSGSTLTVSDGETLIADATGASTWYPAPVAYPMDGVTIAAGETTSSFKLKNTTAAAQTVTGVLQRTGILASVLKDVKGVQIYASEVRGWEPWYFEGEATSNTVFVDTLAAGESRTYRIRFPRAAYDLLARNSAYAGDFQRMFSGVMRFRYGSNAACTYLSLHAVSDNNEVASPWPNGLWVGTFSFDKVSQVKGNQTIIHNVPAKGRMDVRALVHVGTDGACKLLHHVIVETVVTSNAQNEAYAATTLYAGRAKPDFSTEGTVTRLDSIAMDIDNPIVEGTGSITNGLVFAWTMKPEGRGNPFYHPYHPEHDGLQWDFKTAAPSGDDMNNYRQGQVKPETWSIKNSVTLSPDPLDPMELSDTLTGTVTWELGNLRRQVNGEDIRTSGTFSLKRVQSVDKLIEE